MKSVSFSSPWRPSKRRCLMIPSILFCIPSFIIGEFQVKHFFQFPVSHFDAFVYATFEILMTKTKKFLANSARGEKLHRVDEKLWKMRSSTSFSSCHNCVFKIRQKRRQKAKNSNRISAKPERPILPSLPARLLTQK